MGPLCQLLAENPAIHQTILNNYQSELFWLKEQIAAQANTNRAYNNSPEHQADLKNLHIRTLAYKQALESAHLQAMLKKDPMHHQIILAKYLTQTNRLEQKLAANQDQSQNPQNYTDANLNLAARQWAYNYEQQQSSHPKINPADTKAEQEHRQIAVEIEKHKEKLYKQLADNLLAENPQDNQKILASYNKKLNNLQANIAAKKEQQGETYTKSIGYDNDATELQVGDQAYQQVYASVTGQEPEWLRKLNQEVSKNQKRGAWIQLALLAMQTITPHLAQALNVAPIPPKVGDPSVEYLRAKYGVLEKSYYNRLKSSGDKNVIIVASLADLETALKSKVQKFSLGSRTN